MVAKKTKKVKKTTKVSKAPKAPAVLTVDNLKKVPSLEKVLKSGKITVVLVFAEWCGACHRFRKNIWNPMCSRSAQHNRVAVRDDMIKNTSLANAKFEYLPSILIVDEGGNLQSFKSPEGKDTNAMKTPKNLEDMERVVNVPVQSPPPFTVINPMQPPAPEYLPVPAPETQNEQEEVEIVQTIATKTPKGLVYKPTPYVAPQKGGGALLATLQSVSQGVIPTAILGSLAVGMRGGTRKRKQYRTHTRRAY